MVSFILILLLKLLHKANLPNFISLCCKLIIIHYHTPKQREKKFKPRIKLNHNIYIIDRADCSPRCLHRRERGSCSPPEET